MFVLLTLKLKKPQSFFRQELYFLGVHSKRAERQLTSYDRTYEFLSLSYAKWLQSYDFEAYFIDTELKFNAKQVPMSFSLASNVPGYENPEFFTSDKPDTLCQLVLSKLNEHSNKAYNELSLT